MTSRTKALILEQHQKNALLTVVAPSATSLGEHDFSAEEFFVPLDERIIASASEALESGQTHYVDVPGIAPLRQAIAEYLRASYNAAFTQPNVIVTAGIQESRFLTIQMIGEANRRIAIPSVIHPGVLKAIGVRPMEVDRIEVDDQMLATVTGIRKVLSSGSRLIFLESPSRLTGATYNSEVITEIAALVREFKALIIWDQGLAPWVTNYTSIASVGELNDHSILIGEAFPGSGLSSWFIGYIAAPERLVPTMQSQKQIMAICTSTAAQYAALEASKLFSENQANQLRRLQAARTSLTEALGESIDTTNGGAANILALRLSPSGKQQALNRLKEAGYMVTDGAEFGAPEILRVTLSHSSAIETVVHLVKGL